MDFKVSMSNHITSTTPRYPMSKREKLLRWLKDNGIGVQEAIGWLGSREGGKR